MFFVGDKVVHPMHGAGVIESIVSRRIEGETRDYYVLRVPAGGMLVMIPVLSSDEIGMRAIIDNERAGELMDSLSGIEIDMTQNWNRRYRENMLRIKSGDLLEVCKVIKGLIARDRERGLSTGERKMLVSAKQIVISEIVLAQSATYEDVEQRITALLA
ncbi:MAG: CarD family transcriptional regulator [Oscillospiraceae bacterium]|jgi:CarD family transcriptional regulator|nr:CarD family transcriptional regulator [Oscillospiraceae bacterium]